MALPKCDMPIYETRLHSVKDVVRYRPFLAKERKILLMGFAGGDADEMTRSIRQVATNCIISPTIDVEKLPSFDLEYLFVQLRSKSVGEIVTLKFEARKDSKCELCSKPRDIEIDLKNIKLDIPKDYTQKIAFDDTMGVVMKYPNAKLIKEIIDFRSQLNVDAGYKLISNCIECVYKDEDTFDTSDMSEKELLDWVENLSIENFEKLQHYLLNLPKLSYPVDLSCPKCGHKEVFVVEGIENFFL